MDVYSYECSYITDCVAITEKLFLSDFKTFNSEYLSLWNIQFHILILYFLHLLV